MFINGAIDEVLKTLGMASLSCRRHLLFLRDWRATLIPALTMPVSLIGTLAAIYLVGFSINILTLLALVLATGMVVDDAIVVLENIVRAAREGMGPRAAAVLGTQQVFFAVVATTATLAAVFIPLSFLPGQAGGLFREFGFTLAIAVMLSSVTALTLCPVLASRLLTAEHEEGPARRLRSGSATGLALLRRTLTGALAAPLRDRAGCRRCSRRRRSSSAAASAGTDAARGSRRGSAAHHAPQGVALDYTDAKMREIEAAIQPLRDSLARSGTCSRSPVWRCGQSRFHGDEPGHWGERDRSQAEIVDEINGKLRQHHRRPGLRDPAELAGHSGRGTGPAALRSSATNYEQLGRSRGAAGRPAARRTRQSGRSGLATRRRSRSSFIEIDRARASDLGIDIDGAGRGAAGAVLDGRTIGTVFIDDKSYDIRAVRPPIR